MPSSRESSRPRDWTHVSCGSCVVLRFSLLSQQRSPKPRRQYLKRTELKRSGEEPGYIEVLQQRAGSLNIKRLLLIKENQISQVKEFSTFLCIGRCKSLSSLESFLPYASQLSGPVSFIVHIWSSSVLTVGNDCRLMATRSHRYSSPSWVPWGLRSSHLEDHNYWWLWHPSLLIRQEIFHSSVWKFVWI